MSSQEKRTQCFNPRLPTGRRNFLLPSYLSLQQGAKDEKIRKIAADALDLSDHKAESDFIAFVFLRATGAPMIDWNRITKRAESRLNGHSSPPHASKRDHVHDAIVYVLSRNKAADMQSEDDVMRLVAWKALLCLRDAHRRHKRFKKFKDELSGGGSA